jgi:hypothetical protein
MRRALLAVATCALAACGGWAKADCAPPDASPMTVSIALPRAGLSLGGAVVALPLSVPRDPQAVRRLAAAAHDAKRSVILRIGCVQSDRPPGAAWEVYVGLPAGARPRADSPYFVGNIALYGEGVKTQSGALAEFVFPLDRAIAASADAGSLAVTFVPSSGVEKDGRPVPAEVAATVRIGKVELLLEGPPG